MQKQKSSVSQMNHSTEVHVTLFSGEGQKQIDLLA